MSHHRKGTAAVAEQAGPELRDGRENAGITAIALIAVLRTSHRTMPNIVIPDDDLRNVVAYIPSLR